MSTCRHPRRAWIDAPDRMPDGTVRRSCSACGHVWFARGRVSAPVVSALATHTAPQTHTECCGVPWDAPCAAWCVNH